MVIDNRFSPQPLTQMQTHTFLGRDGQVRQQEEPVLSEHSLCVLVNGTTQLHFICLPQFLPELIVGHLVTAGYVSCGADIASLSISASGQQAEVVLKGAAEVLPMTDVIPIPWEPQWVFALADRFGEGMPIHGQTFATHSCFLAKEEKLLFQCEDIGRHNAVDKAVGFALLQGIPLQACLLYSSGRMPEDMAAKVIRAGIPVVASKGAPTCAAVALARQHGLTLICAARRDRMKLYSDPQGKYPIDRNSSFC